MKVNLSIEARMTSTRLPGKVLMPIRGMPMLELQIRKLRDCRLVDEIIVATTVNATDDPIVALCERLGVGYFRGSEQDVLERVVQTHQKFGTDLIVELTGDNPLQDPALVDECIEYFRRQRFDYVSNTFPKLEYPDGMNVQVFPLRVLEQCLKEASGPKFHEHVSLYIYTSGKFKVGYVGPSDPELHWPELSFTVDLKCEYEFVKAAAESFAGLDFSVKDLVQLIRRKPELLEILKK